MGDNDYKSVRHQYYWILVLLVIVINQETHGLETTITTTDVTVTTASTSRCVSKNISVNIGSNVTICCQMGNSTTILMKGGFPILTGEHKINLNADQKKRYKVLEPGKIMITDVREADDSEYGCSSNENIVFHLTVQLPPGPPAVTSNKNVYQSGENATLTCESSGKPAPNIYWMSKGRRIMGVSVVNGRTTTNVYSIIVSRENNKQIFACYVYNDVNVGNPLIHNMKFDVQYEPYVRIKQRINQDPFRVIENTRMTLTCDVDANPPATKITWIKGNRIVDERIPAASTDSFDLSQNVSKDDNSQYECRAENDLGKKTDSLNVEVLYYPRVSVKSEVVVSRNDHVVLNCSADANPPASLRWIGKSDQTRNDNTFIISKVRVGDAGRYKCEARNNLNPSMGKNITGSAYAVTNLHVKYKPGPAKLRLGGPAIKGQNIILICDLRANQIGYPEPSFIWRKIGDINNYKESTNRLIIANATLSDSGQYTCNAKNIEGFGAPSTLDVKVKEYPEFQKKLNGYLYLNITDQSPSLMCKARGNPSPNITWYKDGNPVSRHDYVFDQHKPRPQDNSFVVTSFLHFNNFSSNNVRELRPSDTGNYSCVVTTLLNQSFSLKSTLQIIIKSPPQTDKKNEIVAITLNENASISVLVYVYPRPQFHWFKNNKRLPSIDEELDTINKYRSTLRIASATRSELGVYKCEVNNTYGSLVIKRDIRERSAPDPPYNLAIVDATWESVYLKWIAGFNGGETQTFIVSYRHDKKNYSVEVAAENTGYIFYNITNLMPDTTYNFSVRGSSIIGTGRSSNSFSVHTMNLALPTPQNVQYIVAEKKILFEVKTEYECCTSLLIAKNGGDLKDLRCEPTVKRWKNNTLDLQNNEVETVSVGLCLKRRNELCGNYIQATKVEPNMSAGPLSTLHVIVIAVVCGIILIVLVVILIVFLYWRSRSHKKQYGNEVNYPHISNGSVPNGIAGRQGYDNPDGPYSNGYVENTHNTSSEHTDELPPYTDQDMGQELSDESDLDKPYDTRHINDTMTFYNNPHITRNPNFISLNPEGMPRDTSISGRESGYSTPDSSRPKKVIYEVIV